MPYFLLALPDTFYLWLEPERKAAKAFVEGQRNALDDTTPRSSPTYIDR